MYENVIFPKKALVSLKAYRQDLTPCCQCLVQGTGKKSQVQLSLDSTFSDTCNAFQSEMH